MALYVLPRHDGGVEIMQTVGDADPHDALKKWAPERQAEIDAANIRPCKPEDVPPDRTFRGAWKHDFTIDMSGARDIWRDKMREARAPQLSALDIQYQRALETHNTAEQTRIVAKKQVLRDVTAMPSIDEATTPEELKAIWPAFLDGD